MYNVSQDYITAITNSSVYCQWLGTITTTSHTTYSLTEKNIKAGSSKITLDGAGGDNVKIGMFNAKQLDLQLYLDYNSTTGKYYLNNVEVNRYDFKGADISLTFRLYLTSSTYEDVPIGNFIVNTAERTSNVLSLHAFDYVSKFIDKSFTVADNATPYALLRLACTKAGVTLGTTQQELSSYPNASVSFFPYEKDNYLHDCRDLVCAVCQLICANAYIGRDNKLYVRQLESTTVRTISSSWRYSSNFADYELRYNVLYHNDLVLNQVLDVATGTSGIEYELGTNSFLQYGAKDEKITRLQRILNKLNSVIYTPFEATTPIDPALDVYDILEFTDNQAVSGKKCIITNLEYSLNGSMKLKGVGKDPSISTKDTSTSSQIRDISSRINAQTVYFYNFTNAEDIEIADEEEKKICDIQFTSLELTTVTFRAEIQLDVETTVDDIDYNELNLTVKYVRDDIYTKDYKPKETYVDGNHLLHLLYLIELQAAQANRLEVYLSCDGGSVTIKAGEANSSIYGQGLVAVGIWSGDEIYTDEISIFDITSIPNLTFTTLTDSASASTDITIIDISGITDNIGIFNLTAIGNMEFAEIEESIDLNEF